METIQNIIVAIVIFIIIGTGMGMMLGGSNKPNKTVWEL